jgi:hypothetical protein
MNSIKIYYLIPLFDFLCFPISDLILKNFEINDEKYINIIFFINYSFWQKRWRTNSGVSLIRANWDSVNLCPIINPNNSLIDSGNVERHLAHSFSNFYYLFFAQFIWKKAGIDLKFLYYRNQNRNQNTCITKNSGKWKSARIKIFRIIVYPDFRDFTVYYLI